VQGVGYRWFARVRALELGLVGYAENLPDGRVLVVAEGERGPCEQMLAALDGPDAAGQVDEVVAQWGPAEGGLTGFVGR
jgi:acylphosphatase